MLNLQYDSIELGGQAEDLDLFSRFCCTRFFQAVHTYQAGKKNKACAMVKTKRQSQGRIQDLSVNATLIWFRLIQFGTCKLGYRLLAGGCMGTCHITNNYQVHVSLMHAVQLGLVLHVTPRPGIQ